MDRPGLPGRDAIFRVRGDSSPAYYLLTVIEYGGLARGYGSLGLLEIDPETVSLEGSNQGLDRSSRIADFYPQLDWTGQRLVGCIIGILSI